MALIFIAGYLVLSKSQYGRYIYAIGGNEEASRLSGINTKGVVHRVYLINGGLAGLAGVILASRLGAGVPNSGLQYELDVIAAVVVGGTSLMGGVGSVMGTFWGTLFIGILNNGLNLANVDPYTQKVALGVVILLAVLLDRMKKA
jgi:ribose/xylose/arabinose/galactoside ABC-type transport system permease subunit